MLTQIKHFFFFASCCPVCAPSFSAQFSELHLSAKTNLELPPFVKMVPTEVLFTESCTSFRLSRLWRHRGIDLEWKHFMSYDWQEGKCLRIRYTSANQMRAWKECFAPALTLEYISRNQNPALVILWAEVSVGCTLRSLCVIKNTLPVFSVCRQLLSLTLSSSLQPLQIGKLIKKAWCFLLRCLQFRPCAGTLNLAPSPKI